jgi:hypothetical protein
LALLQRPSSRMKRWLVRLSAIVCWTSLITTF